MPDLSMKTYDTHADWTLTKEVKTSLAENLTLLIGHVMTTPLACINYIKL